MAMGVTSTSFGVTMVNPDHPLKQAHGVVLQQTATNRSRQPQTGQESGQT